jgi:NADPH oxidase 2
LARQNDSLQAIQEYDMQNWLEINHYLTAKLKEDEMNNIIVQDVGADKDAITSLRTPTHLGRPNLNRVFSSVAEMHPQTDFGVVSLLPEYWARGMGCLV